MKVFKIIVLLGLFMSCFLLADTKPEEALNALIEGNKRFMSDNSIHPQDTTKRREETAKEQAPFAVVLGCSDSRASPEILFDQGIGDLFIVRVAGNIVGPIELASIEYAAVYLHASLIVVMGHENCGAVDAVIQGKTKDIEPVAALIKPAVKRVAKMPGNRLENTIKENVALVVAQLQKNSVLKRLIEKGILLIKGGYYNFHTGQVEFLNAGAS